MYEYSDSRNHRMRRVADFSNFLAEHLDRLTGNPYSVGMANVTPLRDNTDSIRAARAAFVHDSLKSERWSVRQAAMAIGMNNSVLATRMHGGTAFLADELEQIAGLLKLDPVDFYRDYISAQEVGPAVLETATSTVESRRFDRPVVNLFDRKAS